MQGFSLRSYQEELISLIYDEFRKGNKKVLAKLQTGGGKSHTFSKIVDDSFKNGIYVIICVKRRGLIEQASKNLDAWKIPHGVHMANHRRFRPKEMVQVCSIDTLSARSLYPHSDKENVLIIIDEAHDCRPTGKSYVKFMDSYPNAFFAGFTATPYGDNSLWDCCVSSIEAHELMEQGFLVPASMYVPSAIDVSNVKIKRTGDYDEKELFKASSDSKVIGDFVRDWKLYSQGRPTVLFAVNIEHSMLITEAFNSAGISAIHADGSTKQSERIRAIESLVTGKIQVLCNVDIFSTGADIPSVGCIQICRPTQSLIWHIQAIGRGLRIAPDIGKKDCRVIDNAGNLLRHGSPYRVHDVHIGKHPKRDPNEEDVSIRACRRCHFIFESGIKQCPECDHINPPIERKIKHEEGELVEYNLSPEERDSMDKAMIIQDVYKLKMVAKRRGMKKNWVYYKLKDKYGVDKLSKNEHSIHRALNDFN